MYIVQGVSVTGIIHGKYDYHLMLVSQVWSHGSYILFYRFRARSLVGRCRSSDTYYLKFTTHNFRFQYFFTLNVELFVKHRETRCKAINGVSEAAKLIIM